MPTRPPILAAEGNTKISFKKTQLEAKFRSEGVAVGDFNHDGKLDIAAGSVYYASPNWDMQLVQDKALEFDPLKYSGSFCNYADDLNHDGWTDLIVVDFPGKETWWYENPQTAAGPWKRHMCVPVTNNESPTYLDLDGDGRRELVFAIELGRKMAFAKPASDPAAPWLITNISAENAPNTERYSHGLGVGDVNRDGRSDVLVPQGWWEGPANTASVPWKFHPAALGDKCARCTSTTSTATAITTCSRRPPINWAFGGTSRPLMAGRPTTSTRPSRKPMPSAWPTSTATGSPISSPARLVGSRPQGRRQPRRSGRDVLVRTRREGGKPKWIPHQFDHDSGVGTQFEVADVNGDGLLDVVTSNKKGVYYFEQSRK